jgi:hypothetical protein
MAEHYFPEVAEWFNQHGVEGALHMLMGRIQALEEKVEGKEKPEPAPQEPPAEHPPAEGEHLPKLS